MSHWWVIDMNHSISESLMISIREKITRRVCFLKSEISCWVIFLSHYIWVINDESLIQYHLVKCGLKMVAIRRTLIRIQTRTLWVRTIQRTMHGRDSIHALRPDDKLGRTDGGGDDGTEILVEVHLMIEKLFIGVKLRSNRGRIEVNRISISDQNATKNIPKSPTSKTRCF